MNAKKRKQCPLCGKKAIRVENHYECPACELVLNFNAQNSRAYSLMFSSRHG